MSKEEFLSALKTELERQNLSNVDNMLQFYDELICDRIEEGMTEEEATASLGSIQEIVKEVAWDKPVTTLVKEKVQQSKAKADNDGKGAIWIIIAVLGFPVWLPLAIVIVTCFAVICLLYWLLVLLAALVVLLIPLMALCFLIGGVTGFNGVSAVSRIFEEFGGALVLGSVSFLIFKPCLVFFKGTGTVFTKMLSGIKKVLFK
ncbi:MAG: DUF1700 domain-containing protein [Lachnospiraceae bacterium]|nr:DUF1700 domain-containing protein [Lachnospiraceae bacterium]